jgi:hypothetical protein
MDRAEASWLGLLEHANELPPDPALGHLSDAQLEAEVRDGASRIAAQTCAWLLHVAELVVRGAWTDQGARTPGQWLSWAVGESSSAAREHVRVGLALRHLPKIRARFAAGTISYSKVRAITRGTLPEHQDLLLAYADAAPASQLATIVAQARRNVDELARWQDGPPEDPPGDAPGDVRGLRRVVIDQDTVELRIRLPKVDAVAVEERIDRLVDLTDRADADSDAADGSAERLPRSARRAIAVCDALAVAVADGPPDRSGVDDHLVVLHVDAADLAAAASAESPSDAAPAAASAGAPGAAAAASAESAASASAGAPSRRTRPYVVTGRGRRMMLARLTCDGDLRVAGIAGDGHPADIGRRSRKVPADLRRAVQLRDRHCRFPGCHRTRGLHAHHVLHWAVGGPTDLSNLLLLCAHHHRFVHDHGWTLRAIDPTAGRWGFHAPDDDTPLAPVLALPGASAETLARARAAHDPPPYALQPPWWDGTYDPNETIRVLAEALTDVAA